MESEMDMVLFIIKREVNILDIGTIIKWMDMVLFIILMVELPIKASGKMIHYMEKEFYIIKTLLKFKANITILVLSSVKKKNHGFHMMDGFKMIKNQDTDNYY